MGRLEAALRARRDAGGRAFLPYVTGGYPGVNAGLLRRLESAGADAIEIGIPFSDPVMDGGVIQEASAEALRGGARLRDVLATIQEASTDVPIVVMTYVNPVVRHGIGSFLDAAAAAGVAGVIVPDLPVDESAELEEAAAARDVDAVLLAAPGTTAERLGEIGRRSRGFVYCVATYGVTGARDRLDDTARDGRRGAPCADRPPLARRGGDRNTVPGGRGLRVRGRGRGGERPHGARRRRRYRRRRRARELLP